ncbi:hypothetical protein CBS101457_003212 [Exobasidium rhododendri]|nr:hypothetical protein CBS101457_003212 [Exobasidium rhododendri]
MSEVPKVVIFDVGGVVVGSPLVGINEYEKSKELPFNYINVAITSIGKGGAFPRLERSEIDMYTFYHDFGAELSQVDKLNAYYTKFCKSRNQTVPRLPTTLSVDGRELFGLMMKQTIQPDRKIVNAIKRLRASGKFKLAALTNNFSPPQTVGSGKDGKKAPSLEEELEHLGFGKGTQTIRNLFDHYIESAVVGMRKPEEGFYRYALDLLKVEPKEVVFLDDIGINLKAAQAIGIHTIRVGSQSSLPAIRELERAVGMTLIDEEDVRAEEARLQSERRGGSRL